MDDQERRELRTQARAAMDKEFERAMLFAAILVLVHLLNITPQELDAGGAKVSLPSPLALRGILAAIFLNKLYSMIFNFRTYYSLGGTGITHRLHVRAALKRKASRGKPIDEVKMRAKIELLAWDLASLPYILLLILILISGVSLAIYDLSQFIVYCYESTPVGEVMQRALRGF